MATDDQPKRPSKTDPSAWPAGVRRISVDELDALGVDANGNLFWHGQRLVHQPPSRESTIKDYSVGIRGSLDSLLESLRREVQSIERQEFPRGRTGAGIKTILNAAKSYFERGGVTTFASLRRAVELNTLNRDELRQATLQELTHYLNEVKAIINPEKLNQNANATGAIKKALDNLDASLKLMAGQMDTGLQQVGNLQLDRLEAIAAEAAAAATSMIANANSFGTVSGADRRSTIAAGVGSAAGSGSASARGSTRPDDVVRKLAQDPIGIRDAARTLSKDFADEIERLKRTRPNEPDQLQQHEDLVETYDKMSAGLADIATALDEAVSKGTASAPEPVCLGIAGKIVAQLQTGVFAFLKKHRSTLWSTPINLCLFGTGVAFLHSIGADSIPAIGGLTAVMLKYGVSGTPTKKTPPPRKGGTRGKK